MPHLFYCAMCNALVTETDRGEIGPCVCGGRYFQRLDQRPEWRLTESDRRMLKSYRISATR